MKPRKSRARLAPLELQLIAAADVIIGLRALIATAVRRVPYIIATTFALGLLAGVAW